MRILFLFSESMRNDVFKENKAKPFVSNDQIPLGLSYISAMLKKNGHETNVFVLSPRTKAHEVYNVIRNYNPQMIGFSLVFREYVRMTALARKIHNKFPDIFLVCGGVHITLHPEELAVQSFNAICVGEGEYAILELANRLERHQSILGISNIWVKQDGIIHKSKQRPFDSDLDMLPYPDRSIWKPYIANQHTPISILLGRGCPYNCTYCSNHSLKSTAPGYYVRFRKPHKIIEELAYLIKKYPENDVFYFEVEAINCNLDFFTLFMDELIKFNQTLPRPIYYGTNIRITRGQNWYEIFRKMRKANISFVNIGLESGSDRVRKEIMHRDYDNNDVLQACHVAKKCRLIVMLYTMMGLPTESLQEYEQTITMIRECRPDILHMSIFYPYPGTSLYELCNTLGITSNIKPDRGRNYASLDLPQFSRRRIQKEYNLLFPRLYTSNRLEFWVLYFLISIASQLGTTVLNKFITKRIYGKKIVTNYIR